MKKDITNKIDALKVFALSEGLPEDDLDVLVNLLITNKLGNVWILNLNCNLIQSLKFYNKKFFFILASSVCSGLFTCFIPEKKISSKCIKQLLVWFFTEVSNQRISCVTEKKFLQWLTGLYECLNFIIFIYNCNCILF